MRIWNHFESLRGGKEWWSALFLTGVENTACHGWNTGPSQATDPIYTPGSREGSRVKCLAQGHKETDRQDSNQKYSTLV
jgi:hypothetical protein